jgi:hypothetical protein
MNMARDWSQRDDALKYFERVKRGGHVDYDYAEEAVNALRRSQDHTAIQNKLNAAMRVLRECDQYLSRSPLESIGSGSELHRLIKEALGLAPNGSGGSP